MHWHSRAGRSRSRRRGRAAWAGLVVWTILAGGAAADTGGRSFDCVIDPSETVKLGSPVPGLLAEMHVGRGDSVSAGQVVARLEFGVEAATVEYYEALAESTARIDAQQARFDLAQARLDRSTDLYRKGIVAQDKFDELVADARIHERDLERVKLEGRLATIEADKFRAQLEQRTIRSAISGIVAVRNLSAGEYVSQDNYIATVVRLDPLYVEAFLPIDMYPRIAIGAKGVVSPDQPIGGRHEATITVIDHVFDPSSATFGVRLELPNPENKLPAGQRCDVKFVGEGDQGR